MRKNMKSILKDIKMLGEDLYDRIYTEYRAKGFRKYYTDSNMTENLEEVLTDNEKKQIDDYYKANYGKKINYCYHRVYKYYSGKFDVKCFPDEFLAPRIFRYINDPSFTKVLSNKNILPYFAKMAGVKMPETVILSMRDIYYDKDYNIISRGEAKKLLMESTNIFVKPSTDSSGGKNCKVYDSKAGYDTITDVVAEEILTQYKTDFSVQKMVVNCQSIKKIYPNALNTFRLVTYFHEGKVYNTNSVLRMGTGDARVDNASQGGLYVGVYDDGHLCQFASNDYGLKGIAEHPDTGVIFKDYVIDEYPKVIETAKKIHRLVPQVGIIDWDLTIDEDGEPVLIESNCQNGGGIQMIQCNIGEGVFRDNTEKVLKWLKKVEKMSKSERKLRKIHL